MNFATAGAAGQYGQVRAFGDMWESATSATSKEISMWGQCDTYYNAQYGFECNIAIDYPLGTGQASASAQGISNNAGATWSVVPNTNTAVISKAFMRGPSAYTVYARARAHGAVVSGYGAYSGDTGWQTVETFEISALSIPNAPSSASAAVVSSAQVNLTWVFSAGSDVSIDGFKIYRSTDSGSYELLTDQGSSVRAFSDVTVLFNHTYTYQIYSYNARSNSATSATTGTVRTANIPSAPTGVTNSRVSDNQNTVSWSYTGTGLGAAAAFLVLRSVDGGPYIQIASTVSMAYADTSTSANHSYTYVIRALNSAGYADSTASTTTYNTPASCSGITAAYAQTSSSVTVSWINPGITANAVELQVSSDNGGTWSAKATLADGSIQYTDTVPPAGTGIMYRVRNTRGALVSAWATSTALATLTVPAAPMLIDLPPANIAVGTPTLRAAWRHNPLDGTPQTKAEVQISLDGGQSWSTSTVNGDIQYVNLPTNFFPDSLSITYRVRTWGNYSDPSPYSSSYTFTMRAAPTVVVASPPTDGAVLTNLPYDMTITYSNQYTQSLSTVDIVDMATGSVVYSFSGNNNHFGIDTFFPTNGGSYRVDATVSNVYGLRATASRLFTVNYAMPSTPTMTGEYRLSSYSIELTVVPPSSSNPTVDRLFITRLYSDGSEQRLANDLPPDRATAVIDMTPLLNAANAYRAYCYSVTGTLSYIDVAVPAPAHGNYVFNWGDGFDNYVSLLANTNYSESPTRNTSVYQIAGRKRPMEFRGENYSEEISLAAALVNIDDTHKEQEQYLKLLLLQGVNDTVLLRTPQGRADFVAAPKLVFGFSSSNPLRSATVTTRVVDGVAATIRPIASSNDLAVVQEGSNSG